MAIVQGFATRHDDARGYHGPLEVAEALLDGAGERLGGPLAFAFWDGAALEVRRDPFGRIPLQVAFRDDGLVVTTDPDVLVHALARVQPNEQRLREFITDRETSGRADLLLGVIRLRPGELLRWRPGGEHCIRRWWRPEPRQGCLTAALRSTLEALPESLPPGPLAVSLSGGLDSSALAAALAPRRPLALTFHDPDSPVDEGARARRTASFLAIPRHEVCIQNAFPLNTEGIYQGLASLGPWAHPDGAWKAAPLKRLRKRRRLLVTGNGADELLWVAPNRWLVAQWQERNAGTLREAKRHVSLRPWLMAALPARGPATVSRADRLLSWRWEHVTRSLAREGHLIGGPLITPFLEAPLWDLGLSLRPSQLVEGGRQKAPLRRALIGLVDEETRTRPKEGGFDVTVERGLAEEAAGEIVARIAGGHLRRLLGLDVEAFLRAFETYRRAPSAASGSCRGSWPIWRVLAAELWLQEIRPLMNSPYLEAGP